MTQQALIAYSVGLMGLIVVKVLAPVLLAPGHQNAGENCHCDADYDSADERPLLAR